MKKIIVLFATVTLILSGCSVFTPKKETVCVYDNEFMEYKITSMSKGDKILTDEFYSSFDMDSVIGDGFSAEEVEKELDNKSEEYDIEGVKYSYKVTDEKAMFTILVDYKKIDFDEAMELGIVSEGSDEDADYIDFETTIESRKGDEMTCKTK